MRALLESEYIKALLVIIIGSLVLLFANIALKTKVKNLESQKKNGVKHPKLNFLRFFQRIAVPLAFLALLTVAVRMVSFNEQIQNAVKVTFNYNDNYYCTLFKQIFRVAFNRYFDR